MEYNYGKTHDVGKEGGKQAEKPTPEANRHESEGKVGVGARWWAGKPTMWVWSTESKQKNTNWKLIDMYRREKCVFWRRSKQKNTRRVFLERKASRKNQNRKFQVNFRVDFCISTQIYMYKDKKRTRHENKERYI